MSPRTKKQFEEIRTKSRQAIMNSALELFTLKGYYGTSVSMIADHAGVSTGLMYNYFESKLELLEAIVHEGMLRIEPLMAEIEKIDDPHQKIAAMVEETFNIANRDMHFWSLYFSVIMQPDLPEKVKGIFAKFIQKLFKLFESLFSQLGYANPQAEARIFGAILDGAILHSWLVGKQYPLNQVKKLIVQKYCGTVKG